jgi:hypothetical protein
MASQQLNAESTNQVRSRVILNAETAAEIYGYKLKYGQPTSFKSCIQKSNLIMKGQSTKLALIYGVSAKTIRDIWNQKSWTSATSGLWRMSCAATTYKSHAIQVNSGFYLTASHNNEKKMTGGQYILDQHIFYFNV